MQATSRLRRRLLASGLIALALAVFWISQQPFVFEFKAKFVLASAPGALLLGIAGMIYPKTLPDPRPPAAVVAASEAGSIALVAGAVLYFIGFGIGVWWIFK